MPRIQTGWQPWPGLVHNWRVPTLVRECLLQIFKVNNFVSLINFSLPRPPPTSEKGLTNRAGNQFGRAGKSTRKKVNCHLANEKALDADRETDKLRKLAPWHAQQLPLIYCLSKGRMEREGGGGNRDWDIFGLQAFLLVWLWLWLRVLLCECQWNVKIKVMLIKIL